MVVINKLKKDSSLIVRDLEDAFIKKGFRPTINVKNPKSLSYTLRVDTDKRGYNVHTYTGRRTNSLNWSDWVEANNLVNDVLDKLKAGGSIKSLGGKFEIRSDGHRHTEEDWELLGNENVGSMMYPVERRDWIVPEKVWKSEKRVSAMKKMKELM